MRYTFVLIHGSWHDGSAWTSVSAHLDAMGHVAHMPTLAGHGPDGDRRVGHEDCVQSVVSYLDEHNISNAVFVGHSFGGTILQRIAERVPDCVRRLVFANAFVLRDMESMVDNLPPEANAAFAQLVQEDGGVTLPFELFREAFINDGDITQARAAYDTLSPTPRRSQTDKISLPTFFALPIPRSYINCTEDIALPPGPDRGWHPHMSSRLGNYRLVQLPGSHEVMFTDPRGMAQAIVKAGRD